MNEITYTELKLEDLSATSLSGFDRYQETHRVWYIEDGQWKQKNDHFVERWDEEEKQLVLQDLRRCVQSGGFVIGAYLAETLVGFANVEGAFFGSQNEYLELPYIHVTHECRGKRIGRELFALCCEKAKNRGARKLYIAAHPSIETQQFYRSVGCTLAKEVNPSIYEKEPLDIQLERSL